MRLCKMFGCLPSALMQEPAEVLRLVNLYDLGRTDGGGDDDHE